MAILNTTMQATGGAIKEGAKGFALATLPLGGITFAVLGTLAFLNPVVMAVGAGLAATAAITAVSARFGGGVPGAVVGGLVAAGIATAIGVFMGPLALALGSAALLGLGAAAVGAKFLGPTFAFLGGLVGLGRGAKNAQQQQQQATLDNKRTQLAELTAQNQARAEYIDMMAMPPQGMAGGRIAYGPHSARVLEEQQRQQQGIRPPSFIP